MTRKKRKQLLFHLGACEALAQNAIDFIERNPHSMLALMAMLHGIKLKKTSEIEPQTPSERHAFERGKKRGLYEREQIARRPIELYHVTRGGVCHRNGGDVELIHAEINPDQYDVFYAGCDRTGLSLVTTCFDKHAPIESGDMAAVCYNWHEILCTVKYINNKIELYDPRNDKHLVTVQADDYFFMIGKLDSSGRDFVYPNAKDTPLSDETRKRGYVTAADIVRGKAADNVGE